MSGKVELFDCSLWERLPQHVKDEINSIINAKPKEMVEVVHGEWVFNQFGEPHCSVCGNYPLQNGDESYALSNYCPNCGADMRGGEKDG